MERAVDLGAAAILAAAVAFACARLGLGGPRTFATAAAAFAIAWWSLARLNGQTEFPLPAIAPSELAFVADADELLLTERLEPDAPSGDILMLDDVLAALGPDSRVVRLFDPATIPSPGQLRQSIDRHLRLANPAAAPPDDSQALHLALAELRRSLR